MIACPFRPEGFARLFLTTRPQASESAAWRRWRATAAEPQAEVAGHLGG